MNVSDRHDGKSTRLVDRARGALLGVAVGDAMGLPSLFHRGLRLGLLRSLIWRFAGELDEQQVLRFPLPFTLGAPDALLLCGTDDAEFAAVSALILLGADEECLPDALLAGWRRHVVDARADVWSGISERASISNLVAGLLPPASGGDNPAHFDDGAVSRAVPVGIRFTGDPARAAAVATSMAQITNAADGVWAAAAMAASVSVAVAGGDAAAAVAAGRAHIPADSWLGRQVARAVALAAATTSPADLAADLSDEIANSSYSFGTVAPETLASAYALVLAAGSNTVAALTASVTVAKQSDSMPAMVGALLGAVGGEAALPSRWCDKVRTLRGVCVPALAGFDLTTLAEALLTKGSSSTGSGRGAADFSQAVAR